MRQRPSLIGWVIYKSTNQTEGGQMGAELTQHPLQSTWWGLCFKKNGRLDAGAAADLFQHEGRATER